MRESDQASLLTGVLEISRSGKIFNAEYYNFNYQWASYLALGAVTAIVDVGDLIDLVMVGNYVSWLIGWSGISAAILAQQKRNCRPAYPALLLLLCPVLFLNLPVLSTNVISVGWLGWWVAVMPSTEQHKVGLFRLATIGLLALLAVGSRADACLALPALCLSWWGAGRSCRCMLSCGPLWSSGLGALAALAFGAVTFTGEVDSYGSFLKWETLSAYLIFGLGGFLVLYVIVAITTLRRARFLQRSSERYHLIIWLAALSLPLLYYLRILYSPRHLTLFAFTLAFCLSFPASRCVWGKLTRAHLGLVGFSLLVPYIVGLRLTSMKSGYPTLDGRATLFPTTDGLWPMGGLCKFLRRLQLAEKNPIDHNQRIWGAWIRLNEESLPPGPVTIFSYGLTSYGRLWASWNRREVIELSNFAPQRSSLIGDDRTFLRGKMRTMVHGRMVKGIAGWWDWVDRLGCMEPVSFYKGGRILHYKRVEKQAGEIGFSDVAARVQDESGGDGFFIRQQGCAKGEWVAGEYALMSLPGEGRLVRINSPDQLPEDDTSQNYRFWLVQPELEIFFRRDAYHR